MAIDLYNGATRIARLTSSAANIGAYGWTISATNVPGTNYSIQISSAINAAVLGASAAPFSIVDQPNIEAIPVALLSSGQPQQFGFIAPGAPSATVWGTTNLAVTNWQNLGQVPVTGSNGVFTAISPYNFYKISVP